MTGVQTCALPISCTVDEVEVNSLVFGIGFHVFKKAGSTAFVLHIGNAAFGSPYTQGC